jgi:hypothetical protein
MFGTIKENILTNLEKTHNESGVNEFKKEFNVFLKTIVENEDLKEIYNTYDLFNQVNFSDKEIAREYVEESLVYLKSFDKNSLNPLKKLVTELKNINKNTIEYKLDQLIFNENLSIKDKAKYKVDLVNLITNKSNVTNNLKESFNQLHDNIVNKVQKLDTEQTKVLDLFIENDSNKIGGYYTELIESTQTIVENLIVESEDTIVIKKLIEVKKRLVNLSNQTPNISEIEKVLELKQSLTN